MQVVGWLTLVVSLGYGSSGDVLHWCAMVCSVVN